MAWEAQSKYEKNKCKQIKFRVRLDKDADIIGLSALLTTTMPVMGEVVKAAEEAGIRDKVKIMVGGAPVTKEFADSIGADAYTEDAPTAAEKALELVGA